MADSPWINNVSADQFETEVIAKSSETPVIVDFWAPWCQPCLQLAPTLERLVSEAGGAVLLAKINIEEEQQLAGMLGVQSIPLVVAFHAGQPVDQFAGVIPEDQIQEFIARLVPSKSAQLVNEARELEEQFGIPFEGEVTVQADAAVNYNSILKVLNTCGTVGFNKPEFIVVRTE